MKARLAFDGGYYQKAKEGVLDLKESYFSIMPKKQNIITAKDEYIRNYMK
jgi:hypothetical protein